MRPQSGIGPSNSKTHPPPPAAPERRAARAALTARSLTCVSASTKKNTSPPAARAPALRTAEILRCSTRRVRTPICSAIWGVESVDASSTTMTSYGLASVPIVVRMLSRHLPIHRSSLCAGTTEEIIAVYRPARAARPRLSHPIAIVLLRPRLGQQVRALLLSRIVPGTSRGADSSDVRFRSGSPLERRQHRFGHLRAPGPGGDEATS